jgi:YVTN family beta-propeller protein
MQRNAFASLVSVASFASFISLALLSACAGPGAAAARAPGVLIVLDKAVATAEFVDTASGAITHTLPTGDGPHEGVVTPDGRLAIVANYGAAQAGDSLSVFDLERGVALEPIVLSGELGAFTRPHGLAFAGDLLLVTCEAQQALIGVDVAARAVVKRCTTGQQGSHMVAATPDGTRAFVANIGSGTMTAIDLATWTVIRSVPTGAQAEGIDVAPDGKTVWVTNRQAGTVTVLDADSLEVLAELACPGFPIRVKHTPDGALALVSCPNDSDVKIFDARTFEHQANVAMEFDLADGAENGLFGTRFGNSAVPIGVLVPPGGRVAYVACAAADRVAVIALDSLTVTTSFAVGREPDGLAWYEPRK